MVATEQNFPRGGKKPKITFNDKKKFDFLASSDNIGKKKRYKAKVIKENVEDESLDHLSDASSEAGENIKAISAEKISVDTLLEGMVVLGRVSSIQDTKLTVMLPGRISGSVMASHISNPYTKMLQSYVNDEVEDIKKLNEIFKIGEYVSASVSSVSKYNGKANITLSLLPQDINKGLLYSNITEGTLLRGAVESKEDHGYVIDLGVPNCRTFLPQKFVDNTLELNVGQVIWCTVKKCQKSPTNSIITVSNLLDHLNSSRMNQNKIQDYTVNDLRPGMPVDFFVNKPLKDGAEGLVLTDIMGYIHLSQIKDKLHTGKTVKAYVLYVMPVTKFPFFTTRNVFETHNPDVEKEAPLKVGQIIEDATVIKFTKKSIILKIKDGIAIMPKSFSQANKLAEEHAFKYYSTGTKHTIRIVSYHLSDYAYVCTDKEHILKEKYFTYDDFEVGNLVEGTVCKIAEKGVLVNINKLKGWIPDMHMSDVGLYQSAKGNNKNIISKKFQIGQKIMTRVLRLNPSINQLHLTTKSSLLSPNLKVLKKFEDAKVGQKYKGFIVHFLPLGAVVSFFGDVTGSIHRSDMSSEYIDDFRNVFNIGQVVNCWIKSVDLEKRSIFLSFRQINTPDATTENEDGKNMCEANYETNKTESAEIILDNNNKKSKQMKIINKEIPLEKKSKKLKKAKEESTNECVLLEKKRKLELAADEILPERKRKNSNEKEKDLLNGDIPVKNKDKNSKKSRDLKNVDDVEEISLRKENKKLKKKKEMTNNLIDNLEESTSENIVQKKKKKKSAKVEELASEETSSKKKSKKSLKKEYENITENNKVNLNNINNSVEKSKSKKRKGDLLIEESYQKKAKIEFSGMQNFWDLDASVISKNLFKKNESSSGSDSEEETCEEKTKKKKKKLTNAEKVEKARLEEEKLKGIEKQLTMAESKPQSSDHFDRLLLADPNNSELWIAYMAFHLQATEIERARVIAKKALNTISFREEHEKLNVWLALLNLENRFGTKESLNLTLQDALQMNERYAVHSKMLDMYAETGKMNELSALIDTMLSKYKSNPDMYVDVGQVCFKAKMVEKARVAMQKAISRLDNKKHVPILIKFAHMENNNGDTERAETIFEQIVGCLPLRVDVWCVYIDMLTKNGKIDNARLIFERATAQKLSIKKMKTLYKKWIEMEEGFGDSESVELVRKTAMEYINKANC